MVSVTDPHGCILSVLDCIQYPTHLGNIRNQLRLYVCNVAYPLATLEHLQQICAENKQIWRIKNIALHKKIWRRIKNIASHKN
jgi:hypothetical protein